MEKEKARLEMGEGTPPPLKKVAIVGFSQHKVEAPYNDPSFEIWGLNDLHESIPRWNRWFEMHSDKQIKDYCSRKQGKPYLEGLAGLGVPVFMQKPRPEVPTSVEYPIERMKALFGDYFTNSISYMLALAIDEGYQEIHVYGVDMAQDCLAPEMRVLTADLLWVPVGDLKVGDELLAFDEEPPVRRGEGRPEFRKYRKTRVESLSRITRPCHDITMGDGTRLIASVGHKWLTMSEHSRKWLRTDKLQPWAVYGEHPSSIVKLMEPWKPALSRNAGYLAAAFDGEGHISQGPRDNCTSSHMSVGFSQKENAMSREVELALAGHGYKTWKGESAEGCYKYTLQGGRHEHLRFLGEMRPPRLLAKFDPDQVGTLNCKDNVVVGDSQFIGEREVVGITTGTGTLIVEGFASHNSEYGQQRPSCEYFLGVAVGRGCRVYLPKTSDLLKVRWMYGYEDEIQDSWSARVDEIYKGIQARRTQAEQAQQSAREACLQYLGAEDAIRTLKRIQVS